MASTRVTRLRANAGGGRPRAPSPEITAAARVHDWTVGVRPGEPLEPLPFLSEHTRAAQEIGRAESGLRLEVRVANGDDYVFWSSNLKRNFDAARLERHLSRLDGEVALTIVTEQGPGYLGAPRLILDAVVLVGEWVGAGAVGVAIDRIISRSLRERAAAVVSSLESSEATEYLARWMIATRFVREHNKDRPERLARTERMMTAAAIMTRFDLAEETGRFDAVFVIDGIQVRQEGSARDFAGAWTVTGWSLSVTPTGEVADTTDTVEIQPRYEKLATQLGDSAQEEAIEHILNELSVEAFMDSLVLVEAVERGPISDLSFLRKGIRYSIEVSRKRSDGFFCGRIGWAVAGASDSGKN